MKSLLFMIAYLIPIYYAYISPSPSLEFGKMSTILPGPIEREVNTLNMNASFIQELDQLDVYMVNLTKYESVCKASPSSLSYCKHIINYPIVKFLAEAPYFQDSMARTAVETLSILTEGETTKCEDKLKQIFCKQKFPECFDYLETMKWNENNTRECYNLVDGCSQKAIDALKKMKICEKLSTGDFNINTCIPPMSPIKTDICSQGNISTWLFHSSIEINALLKFQFSLNEKLTEHCKENLTSFMCFTGQQCFSQVNITQYLHDTKHQCENTVKSCQGEELSRAIKDLFLNCDKYNLVVK